MEIRSVARQDAYLILGIGTTARQRGSLLGTDPGDGTVLEHALRRCHYLIDPLVPIAARLFHDFALTYWRDNDEELFQLDARAQQFLANNIEPEFGGPKTRGRKKFSVRPGGFLNLHSQHRFDAPSPRSAAFRQLTCREKKCQGAAQAPLSTPMITRQAWTEYPSIFCLLRREANSRLA